METLALNVFGIEITWDGKERGAASITSTMKEADTPNNHAFNTGVDAIESMVLAHFVGLDVTEPAYLEGIETAYLALVNKVENDVGKLDSKALKNELKGSSKLRELSSTAVNNMGDIFWDAADHGETTRLPCDIAQKCVEEAILAALVADL